ncbi:cytochrome c biogenesis protein ResB [Geomonas paludis]|uniref:ResB-like domain-containing protein n=1 Tax=Geomonas paludis TaxID=2740185 RepID=A0A6V8N299_9BACT|nr:cytochrome c biogenesis protein ResB [Geomonas paludis]GFO66094.1 hypothetical protein GMPD_40130 [Geomonas paludis]
MTRNERDEVELVAETESFPVEPRYHPIHRIPRMIYDFLASARLAMALLVAILVCCLAGVTVVRGAQAWLTIFSTLWFNALLVLLVVNVACCFFGRIWHRRITVISFGMILFHMSFVAMFLAIVYDSLFFFQGSLRLTEGETLQNSDPHSYDGYRQGRFFSFSRLKGETTLVKMIRGYRVGGEDKRAAYDVEVGEPGHKRREVIYITNNLDYKGVKYLPEKEGYSALIVLSDKTGKELYGAHVPLQSLKQKDNSYLYTTGTKEGAGSFPFPQDSPLYSLQVAYRPDPVKDRSGEVFFQVWPYREGEIPQQEQPAAAGKAPVGQHFSAGGHTLAAKEIRYWVGMNVRHDPGKPVILASLWVGLAGMIITTFGRMRKGRAGKG